MLGLSVPHTTQEKRLLMVIIGLVVLETALVAMALVPGGILGHGSCQIQRTQHSMDHSRPQSHR